MELFWYRMVICDTTVINFAKQCNDVIERCDL